MTLSDRDIIQALVSKRIVIDPAPNLDIQLGSCSIDLRLGNAFRIFNHSKYAAIDTRGTIPTDEIMKEINIPDGEAFIMQPREYVLASTIETLTIGDDLMGRIEGRSSLGRLGIIVHGTASIFDPGWHGKVTMELGNLGVMPVHLYPGMRICAFAFEELSSPSLRPYRQKPGAKYANQMTPLASKLAEEQR